MLLRGEVIAKCGCKVKAVQLKVLLQGDVIAKCGCIDPFLAITDNMWLSKDIPFCHNVGVLGADQMSKLDAKATLETLLPKVSSSICVGKLYGLLIVELFAFSNIYPAIQ